MGYISKTLNEILECINFHILVKGCTDNICDVKTDSRVITTGDMYIAIKGQKYDGHDFIEEAYNNGASYIVINKDMEDTIEYSNYSGITLISVDDTRVCLPYIINNLYSHPSKNFTLIGVTGTNGKTSVITLAKHVLTKLSYKTGLIGTINNYINDEILTIETTTPTTPDCIELGMIMHEFVKNKVDIALMEASSMALKTHRVDGQQFHVGAFTNISPEHLDDHKTMEDYVASKLMLFDKASNAVINMDDTYSDMVFERCQGKIIRYGIQKPHLCDIYAKDIIYKDYGVSYVVVYNNKEYTASTNTPSEFSVYNHLTVMGICLQLGLDLEKVINLLSEEINIEGRYDVVKVDGRCAVIIDFAHTPAALENLLVAVRKNSSYKRIITIFGCGGDRDRGKRSVMGRISQEGSDITIITSDNPRTEEPMNIIHDIMEGVDIDTNNYYMIPDRKEAIEYGIQLANEDDVVVIAGKGHEKQQIFNGYTIGFDDKEIAKTVLLNGK